MNSAQDALTAALALIGTPREPVPYSVQAAADATRPDGTSVAAWRIKVFRAHRKRTQAAKPA